MGSYIIGGFVALAVGWISYMIGHDRGRAEGIMARIRAEERERRKDNERLLELAKLMRKNIP